MARTPGSRVRNYDIEPAQNPFGPQAVEPHSPWQLMIEKAREEKKITLRDLASRAQIPPGTLFNWVRNKRGCPSRSTYTANLNSRFAKALEIKPEDLADAYNRSAYTPIDPAALEEDPPPRPAPHISEGATALDGLMRFMSILKAAGRESFSIGELELSASMILEASVKPLDKPKPPKKGR
jgi:transcriptional regulator with XRE-family HTH domain